MLIFAAILAIFVYGMIAAMLGTILPELSERFHLTPSQNGTIAFAQAIGLMIASVGVGPLLDSQGDKIGLVLGLAFIAVTLFLLPRSRGFGSIVVLLFGRGVGGGIVVTGANALANSVSGAHSAIALNLVNLFFGLGGLATPFLAANLFKRNWVKLCYTVAVLTVVTLAFHAATPMPAPAGGEAPSFAQAGPIFSHPLIFLIGLFLFIYISCASGRVRGKLAGWRGTSSAQGIPGDARASTFFHSGFALGLLVGRFGGAVSPILINVHAAHRTLRLAASIAMAISTFFMLRTVKPGAASCTALVFIAGVLNKRLYFPRALNHRQGLSCR